MLPEESCSCPGVSATEQLFLFIFIFLQYSGPYCPAGGGNCLGRVLLPQGRDMRGHQCASIFRQVVHVIMR